MNFIDDREKMLDYFNMERDAFLEMYDYLTDKDYTETSKEIGYRIKFTDYKYYDYEHCEGMELGNIVYADMMYKYLLCRKDA